MLKENQSKYFFQQLAQLLRSEQIVTDVKVLPGAGEPSRVLEKCRNVLHNSGVVHNLLTTPDGADGGGCRRGF